MNFLKILVPVAVIAAFALAYHFYGGAGIALAGGLVVMALMLHFTRMMNVLKRTTNRPIGHVGSAVMLNAKLKPGMTLLHVIAMTRSLGEPLSEKDAQPEVFRWIDGTRSHVTCTFAGGKLAQHSLVRPGEGETPPAP